MSFWRTLLGPSPLPHSHLVQHIGYGQATAQFLRASTEGWNMERLQLWGRGKSNGRVRTWDHPTTTILQTFPIRNFTRLDWSWLETTASQLRGKVASAHLGPEGAWPQHQGGTESPGPHRPCVNRPAHLCPCPT